MALGKTRFTWNPQVNFRQGFSEEGLIDDASGILAGLFYVLVPSLFGLNGWAAAAVGAGIPYLAGKLFRAQGLCSGAIATFTAHVLFAKVSDSVSNMLGKPIWTLNTVEDAAKNTQSSTQSPNASVPDMNYNSVPVLEKEGVNDFISLPNGERIVAFSPQDIDRIAVPINDGGAGMNDVVSSQQQTPWNGTFIQKPRRNRVSGYLNAA